MAANDTINMPLLLFCLEVMSDSLRPHELQHARLPCPSLSPRVCSNSCPLSQWCHPTISSSVTPFSSCPQSFPASESFPMGQLFISGGQSIGASTSASVLPMKGLMCCSVQFSCSVMSDSLQPHGLQHTRLPCPSPIPEAYSNLCPLSQWCHPIISSSIPFSSHHQSFLLAHPLKISVLCPLFPFQQLPHVLAHLLSSSSNKDSYSVALTSLHASASKPTPAGLAHLSKATLLVTSPVARAFTSGGDPSAAFERWDLSFLRDVIFPLASGQHTSSVSSCLNGCSFSVSVTEFLILRHCGDPGLSTCSSFLSISVPLIIPSSLLVLNTILASDSQIYITSLKFSPRFLISIYLLDSPLEI